VWALLPGKRLLLWLAVAHGLRRWSIWSLSYFPGPPKPKPDTTSCNKVACQKGACEGLVWGKALVSRKDESDLIDISTYQVEAARFKYFRRPT
jgi:hypothetical protein